MEVFMLYTFDMTKRGFIKAGKIACPHCHPRLEHVRCQIDMRAATREYVLYTDEVELIQCDFCGAVLLTDVERNSLQQTQAVPLPA
jgi:uncharacterized protein with PIN domain